MTLLATTPAYAGTLTSATFTAQTPYTYAGTSNNRHDYGFTTATNATLSKVTVATPVGVQGSGQKYLALPGDVNNYATSNATIPTNNGVIDIRVKLQQPNWVTQQIFITKGQALGERSFHLYGAANKRIQFVYSIDGSAWTYAGSSAFLTLDDSKPGWVRSVFTPNDGNGNKAVTYYQSVDGINWTFLSYTATAGPTTVFSSTAPVRLVSTYQTKTFYADVRSTADANPLASPSGCTQVAVNSCFDANQSSVASPGSWTSPVGETWNVARGTGANPTDIASDLPVSAVTGVPSGGSASYRMIENRAVYQFAPTPVAAGIASTLSLSGLTNPTNAGFYASTISTSDNAAIPALVDSANTNTLTFTLPPNNPAVVGVAVDPTFAFTVSGSVASCNGLAKSTNASSTATAVQLGNISAGSRSAAAQTLTVDTNSANGFKVFVRSASPSSAVLRNQIDTSLRITDTAAGPIPAATTAAFGFTTDDIGVAMPSGNVAPVPNSSGNAELINAASGVLSRASCVGYFVSVNAATPAGVYTTANIYTAVPNF